MASSITRSRPVQSASRVGRTSTSGSIPCSGEGSTPWNGMVKEQLSVAPPGSGIPLFQPQAPVVGRPTRIAYPEARIPLTKCSQALAQSSFVSTATRPA